jgi:hypothetical protein
LRLGKLVYRKLRRRLGRVAKKNPRIKYMWRGIDLYRELHRLVKFCPPHVRDRPPSLLLIHHLTSPRDVVATADLEWHRMEIHLWPTCSPGWALASQVHELAHFSSPDNGHGDQFRSAMIELVRDGYGVEPDYPSGRSIQDLDRSVEDALATWFCQEHPGEDTLEALSLWLEREGSQRRARK